MNNYCDVCWILLPSESHRISHYNSEKHKANDEIKRRFNKDTDSSPYFVCTVCCVVANTKNQLVTHLASKNHFKKCSDRAFIREKFLKNSEINPNISPTKFSKETFANKFIQKHQINLKSSLPSSTNSSLYSSNESIASTDSDHEDFKVHKINNFMRLSVKHQNPDGKHQEQESKQRLQEKKETQLQKECPRVKEQELRDEKDKDEQQQSDTKKKQFKDIVKSNQTISSTTWCTTCYVRYSSNQNREQHVNGHSHKKREEACIKYKDMSNHPNYCKLCYTMTNDKSQLERHLKSENHERAIKQYIEFYNLIQSNSDNNYEIPFTVDETGKLIDNKGCIEIIPKHLNGTTFITTASSIQYTNNSKDKSDKQSFSTEDDPIELQHFDYKDSILKNVTLDTDKLDDTWSKVLASFEILKNSFAKANLSTQD